MPLDHQPPETWDALLAVWRIVDAVLDSYDPGWTDQEIADKAEQRERMRRALIAAGLFQEAP